MSHALKAAACLFLLCYCRYAGCQQFAMICSTLAEVDHLKRLSTSVTICSHDRPGQNTCLAGGGSQAPVLLIQVGSGRILFLDDCRSWQRMGSPCSPARSELLQPQLALCLLSSDLATVAWTRPSHSAAPPLFARMLHGEGTLVCVWGTRGWS